MATKHELKRLVESHARAAIGRLLDQRHKLQDELQAERVRVQCEVRAVLKATAKQLGVVFSQNSESPRISLTFVRDTIRHSRPYYNPARDPKLLAATKRERSRGALLQRSTAAVAKTRDALRKRLVFEDAADVASSVKLFCDKCDKIGV